MGEEQLVTKIKNGSVIDHIPGGAGLRVMEVLKKDHEFKQRTALVLNADSKSLGKKDILKIEGVELTKTEIDKISLLAPAATINIIRNYNVAAKKAIELPKELSKVVSCPNPKCITHGGLTVFHVESKKPIVLRCHYCERTFPSTEVSIF